MATKKLPELIVKRINKFHVTADVIETIETSQLAKPKFEEPYKENVRNIEKIKINKNKPIVIVNPKDKSIICTIPIVFQGRLLIAEFPNLLTLYLNNAIASYNFSNEILNETEIISSYRSGEMIRFSNQKFYNSYLLNRINIVFYLAFTLELLLNSKIPFDYKHKKQEILLGKKEIEERLSFKEKLSLVNKLLKGDNKHIDKILFDTLIELYSIRSNLVHPKTADAKIRQDYSLDDIAKTFSDDVVKYINAVIKTLDKWEPGLLTFEEIA